MAGAFLKEKPVLTTPALTACHARYRIGTTDDEPLVTRGWFPGPELLQGSDKPKITKIHLDHFGNPISKDFQPDFRVGLRIRLIRVKESKTDVPGRALL